MLHGEFMTSTSQPCVANRRKGSRSYPYKGVLDKIATRSYSNTNAWTATDHTAYTLDTAGWEGFAQIRKILPFLNTTC